MLTIKGILQALLLLVGWALGDHPASASFWQSTEQNPPCSRNAMTRIWCFFRFGLEHQYLRSTFLPDEEFLRVEPEFFDRVVEVVEDAVPFLGWGDFFEARVDIRIHPPTEFLEG